MGVIKIPERTSDNFGDPISKLLNIQLEINNLNPDTEKQFDFSECKFFNPYLLGGITSIYQNEISKNNKITIRLPNSFTIKEYLNTIHFPHGFPYNPNEIENFQIALNYFDTKTYIPIVFFPATKTGNNSEIREKILFAVNNLFKVQLKLSGGVLQAIYYMIDELTQNIVDHSNCDKGLVFAQFYPSKNYMDICISDNGIGLLQGYINSGKYSIESDKESLSLAVTGKSTKDLPESRGFGLSTSRKMLVKGLKGKFLLWSGSAMFIQTVENEEILALKSEYKFQGCLIALRIPTFNNKEFNFYDFTE